MKKIFKIYIIVLIISLCSGCNGDVTRDLRHAGFSIGSNFKCSIVYPKDKEDTTYSKIRYLTDNHMILEDGTIYEVSMSKVFTNEENCKPLTAQIKAQAILDDKIVKANDGRYYYLVGDNNVEKYSEVTPTDNSYAIYDLLLKEDDVVKVVTADGSAGVYYTLKVDGNIYAYGISSQNRNTPPMIVSTMPAYNYSDFGNSRIIDFAYAGDSLKTFVKTEDNIYRMRITNSDECSKYSDVKCDYILQRDEVLDNLKNRIIAYNGTTLITDYKKIFEVKN